MWPLQDSLHSPTSLQDQEAFLGPSPTSQPLPNHPPPAYPVPTPPPVLLWVCVEKQK